MKRNVDQPKTANEPAASSPSFDRACNALEILPQDVARMMSSGADFLLIDCRKPEEREISSIPGAVFVPMQDLDLHMSWLHERAEQFIVVHCGAGRRSMSMTLLLRELGFSNVKSMLGGIERWAHEIDPTVVKTSEAPPKG